MPNGGDVPGGTGLVGPVVSLLTRFVGGLFGGKRGPSDFESLSPENQAAVEAALLAKAAARPATFREASPFFTPFLAGRPPIPTPAEGGPPLVTERFADLPGPFVPQPELPILQELGIPFPEPEPLLFRPGPIPEPDVLEEDMALDVPLLAGFGPLVRQTGQAISPTIGAIAGGFLQDIFFNRAPQELGVAQVPMRRAPTTGMEKPSTRILRRIFENTGVRIKLSAAKALTRQLGLQAAANCLRVSVMDLCTLIITPSPRRRRGISGSDIRIVKRTARRFQSLQEDLSGLVSRRRAAPRRRRQHVHAVAHTAPGG